MWRIVEKCLMILIILFMLNFDVAMFLLMRANKLLDQGD